MLEDGADIVDIGGESTRPGKRQPLGIQEEIDRVLPVLEGVLRHRPESILSIDTYKSATAAAALHAGAQIVNDVSGFSWDEAMAGVCATAGCGVVLMHLRGRPEQWEELPEAAGFAGQAGVAAAPRASPAGGNREGKNCPRPRHRLRQSLRPELLLTRGSGRVQPSGAAATCGCLPQGISGQDSSAPQPWSRRAGRAPGDCIPGSRHRRHSGRCAPGEGPRRASSPGSGSHSRCRLASGCFLLCVRTERDTAGPSTALRSGRDDNSVEPLTVIRLIAFGPFPRNRIVIPTGAQRNGGTCCVSSGSHATSLAPVRLPRVQQ